MAMRLQITWPKPSLGRTVRLDKAAASIILAQEKAL
jgi:hypothetical protein